MRTLIRCAAPCLLAIAAGCGPDVKAGDVPADVRSAFLGSDAPPAASVAADPVILESGVVAYPAVLFSDLDADIGARKDGVLVSMSVDLGDEVRAGQTLAVLQDLREAARVEAAAGALELVRAEHARAEQMREKSVISGADYEAVLLRLRHAESALREAQVELELTRVVAPFSGVVTRRYTGRGRSLEEGEPLYRVTALTPLRASVRVPERAARALRRGAPAVLRSDAADPPSLVEATVARISPAVDAASGTVEVLLLVPKPGPLRPGSAATAEFPGA